MAKYEPITKTLKKATPTIRTEDNVVKSWDIEVVYAYAGDEAKSLPAWESTYSEKKDVENLGKTATQFTQAELIGFMNPIIENHIFEAHYEAFNLPAAEEPEKRVDNFDINSLS